jgi:hypothetical protein
MPHAPAIIGLTLFASEMIVPVSIATPAPAIRFDHAGGDGQQSTGKDYQRS